MKKSTSLHGGFASFISHHSKLKRIANRSRAARDVHRKWFSIPSIWLGLHLWLACNIAYSWPQWICSWKCCDVALLDMRHTLQAESLFVIPQPPINTPLLQTIDPANYKVLAKQGGIRLCDCDAHCIHSKYHMNTLNNVSNVFPVSGLLTERHISRFQ